MLFRESSPFRWARRHPFASSCADTPTAEAFVAQICAPFLDPSSVALRDDLTWSASSTTDFDGLIDRRAGRIGAVAGALFERGRHRPAPTSGAGQWATA